MSSLKSTRRECFVPSDSEAHLSYLEESPLIAGESPALRKQKCCGHSRSVVTARSWMSARSSVRFPCVEDIHVRIVD